MAILKDPCDKDFRGTIDKLGERTVISSYPDMSAIKPSGAQQEHRKKFNKAQKYAGL